MLRRSLLTALAALGLLAPARAQDPAEAQRIVVFSAQSPWAQRRQLMAGLGLRVVRELKIVDALVVRIPKRLAHVEAQMRGLPQVVRIEDDPVQNWLVEDWAPSLESIRRRVAEQEGPEPPQDPFPMPSLDPELPWGIARVNAPKAWAVGRGAGVKVAVIDTGIDPKHPDLSANVAGGWNAIEPEKPFDDDHGHGTHVAGTVAAVQDSTGVVGVAPSARLYGVKVLNAWGSGTFSDVIAGIDWAVSNRMDVANMSLGASRGTDSLAEAVRKAAAAGVAVVCAAGNSGGAVGYPAAYPEAIAVSASNVEDKLASFSSRGPEVDFIAPGVDVRSAVPGGGFDSWSGTSMATPHVAGLAALKIGQSGRMPVDALRAALAAAAAKLPDLKPEEQGAGLIDAGRLLGAQGPSRSSGR